jgi:TRAP-type C4-dicarboxylate transport system substrate-binding protein
LIYNLFLETKFISTKTLVKLEDATGIKFRIQTSKILEAQFKVVMITVPLLVPIGID